jgi:hypothetical protein
MRPLQGLCFHAPLSEGSGTTVGFTADGKAGSLTSKEGIAWGNGHVAAKAFKSQAGGVLEIPQAGDFEKDQAFSYGAWVNLTKRAQFGALLARMDDQHGYRGWDLWLENNRVGTHIIHKWEEDALKVLCNTPVKLNAWNHLFVTYDGSGKASGVKVYINGVLQETTVVADSLKNTIRTPVPLKIAQRHSGQRVEGALVQDVRIYRRALADAEVDQLVKATRAAWLAAKPADQRSTAENNELFDWWLRANDKLYQSLTGKLVALQREEVAIQSSGTIAHVMHERAEVPTAYILFRGEYDRRRDPVEPGTPHVLPPMPPELPRNRLGFAQWLLRPEQPLTARVAVNRFWQEVFGTGLVRTSEDFGVTGEPPSHPELLDWLAAEFRESSWDIQHFFQLLVSSATYRQAALTSPEKLQKDPQNRLLSRGPRFRMDAEMIRDYALAASGLLRHKIGGRSVNPYQPDGVWEAVAIIGSNTRDYRQDSGDNLYRRSLYTFWKRSAPPASMEIFNAPTREVCTVRRERTDTPLQALVTLNDPQFMEAARYLAQQALKVVGRDRSSPVEAGIDFVARRVLARPLRPAERKVATASLNGPRRGRWPRRA